MVKLRVKSIMSGRNLPLYCRGIEQNKNKRSLDRAKFFTLGLGSDGCQLYYITISLDIKHITVIIRDSQGRRQGVAF